MFFKLLANHFDKIINCDECHGNIKEGEIFIYILQYPNLGIKYRYFYIHQDCSSFLKRKMNETVNEDSWREEKPETIIPHSSGAQ